MNSPERITIVLADDHPIVREGLRDILGRGGRFEIVGEAADGEEALRIVRETQPDVLLLDIEMPRMSGLDVAEALQKEDARVAILILTMYHQESIFNRAMDLGVIGYMLKDSAGTDITRGITAVTNGEYYISPALTKYAMRGKPSAREERVQDLTQMEKRVFTLIAKSRTTRQIAEELSVSPRTIEHHRANICEKLNLSGSYALLRFALENKVVM